MLFNFNAAEAFKIAVNIEENGKAFYEKCLSMPLDPNVKALFEDLAQQEAVHKERFQALLKQLPNEAFTPTVWDPDNELDQYIKMIADQHVFVSDESTGARLAQVKDAKDALRLAIEFEKDSVIFFLSLQEAAEGRKGQELIDILVKEEQQHLKRLSLELLKLKQK